MGGGEREREREGRERDNLGVAVCTTGIHNF